MRLKPHHHRLVANFGIRDTAFFFGLRRLLVDASKRKYLTFPPDGGMPINNSVRMQNGARAKFYMLPDHAVRPSSDAFFDLERWDECWP